MIPENEENTNRQEEGSKSHVPNPFDPNDQRELSAEEIENEKKFKEALTERE